MVPLSYGDNDVRKEGSRISPFYQPLAYTDACSMSKAISLLAIAAITAFSICLPIASVSCASSSGRFNSTVYCTTTLPALKST